MGNFKLKTSLFLFGACALASGTAEARDRVKPISYTPVWSKQRNIARDDTNSYLDSGSLTRKQNIIETFFSRQDKKVTNQLRQDYQLRQAAYESRRSSGLTKVEDDRLHNEQMSAFSKDAMNRLSRVHAKSLERRAKVIAEDIPEAREPVAVAALAAALYRGHTFKFRAAGARWESRADAKDRNAEMALVLPGLRSSVGYTPEDNIAGKVNADLMPNISAELNTAQKGSVSLNYGVSF